MSEFEPWIVDGFNIMNLSRPDTIEVIPCATGCEFVREPEENPKGVLESTVPLVISGIVLCIQMPMAMSCVITTSISVHGGALWSSDLFEDCLKDEFNLWNDDESDILASSSMLQKVEIS